MSRSSAAAFSIAEISSDNLNEYEETRGTGRVGYGEPEAAASDFRRKQKREEVPPHAKLWGFVRRTEGGQSRNAELMAQDTVLWYDRNRHRFLVSFDKLVIDDLSPLEFIQFIRQLRRVSTRILFKMESTLSGTAGRARRVWS